MGSIIRVGLVSLLLVGLAVPASAKDLCIKAGNRIVVFKKVKKLKPGRAVPVIGLYLESGDPGQTEPFSGAATMSTGGTIKVGFTVFTYYGDFVYQASTNSAFAGTYLTNYVNPTVFNSVDCATVPIP